MIAGERRRFALLTGLIVVSLGCTPTLDDRPWLIARLQIVGWKAEPPEAAPGASVMLQALAVEPAGSPPGSPPGPLDMTTTSWTLCHTPKPPAENRVVSPDCLASAAPADAVGDPVLIQLPTDACRVFGPDVPQPPPGAPTTRARDPDATGGYYQPVKVALGSALAIGLERITCDLPEASLADSRAFRAAYQSNQNPTLTGLTFTADDGGPLDPGAVAAGAHVTIQAAWLDGAIETFPVFDRQSRTIVETMETLVASWYVTGGVLDQPAAEITDPAVLAATTGWTAPPGATTVQIVFVLRDSRGGSDTAAVTLVISAP